MEYFQVLKNYSFPAFLGLSVGLLWEYSVHINRSKRIVSKGTFRKVFILLLLTSWVGAKLMYFLTKGDPNLLLEISFWFGGGFVFYGGLIFGLSFLIIFKSQSDNKKINLNVFLPGVVFAHSLGRLGCFFSGCCFGSFCPLPYINRWPTQLMESGFLFLLAIYLHKMNRENKNNIFKTYLILYSLFRFFIEFLRGDEIRGIWFLSLSTSQLISIALLSVCIGFYLKEIFSTKSSGT